MISEKLPGIWYGGDYNPDQWAEEVWLEDVRLMKLAQRMDLPDFLGYCAMVQGVCHNTEDHIEAVNAFLDKRTPSFTGR